MPKMTTKRRGLELVCIHCKKYYWVLAYIEPWLKLMLIAMYKVRVFNFFPEGMTTTELGPLAFFKLLGEAFHDSGSA